MKKIFYTIAALITVVAIQSCDKHVEGGVTKQVTIDTTLTSGQIYQLKLSQYGDADDVATITQQGSAYSLSSIANTVGTFAPVYSYSATTAKTEVTDRVVLAVTEGLKTGGRNGGANCNNHSDSTIITINFTVK